MISRRDCHTFDNGSWIQSSPLAEARILAASILSSPFDLESQKLFVTGGFNGAVRDSAEVLTK